MYRWYRNEPKKDYGVQGWKKNRIYADFIFTDKDNESEHFNRVFVAETKGLHLLNPDTQYKKDVFQLCNQSARKTTRTKLGQELDLPRIEFCGIDEENWQRKLNELFAQTI